jgi:hypothetical protein
MTVLGFPLGSALALVVIVALPLGAYGLYRIDRARGNGHVTVLGYRGTDTE